jgi:hypothetical protein
MVQFKGSSKSAVIRAAPFVKQGIPGNPTMIKAFEAGVPANGKPVPDGR